MGLPAARIGDMHTCPMIDPGPKPHLGGPIIIGFSTVLIGGMPAARRLDKSQCVGSLDPIMLGSFSVQIGGQPAARMGDPTAHGGLISGGCPTVLIGDLSFSNSAQSFATQEEAAMAALRDANPQSIRDNLEYGGLIYRDAAGQYHYTTPLAGTAAGFNPGAVTTPPGTTVVGDYHTHGDYSSQDSSDNAVRTSDPATDVYNSDNFSSTDRTGIASDASGNPDYRGYVGTPSGTFREYNPHTNTERVLN